MFWLKLFFITLFCCCIYYDFSKAVAVLKEPKPTAWDTAHPEWSVELKTQAEKFLTYLEKAGDITDWCPAYTEGSKAFRIAFWAKLAEQIAWYESNWDPAQVTYENSLGKDSVGLFQFSTDDNFSWCEHATEAQLKLPLNSIDCFVPLAAKLISQDKIITSGSTTKPGKGQAKGLGRYFSTMWPYATSYAHQGHVEDIRASVKDWCN